MDNSRCIHRVQYYETDRMAIVHHSNYIRWMEEARLDFMRNNGADCVDIEYRGVQIPVVSIDCRYKNSARFGDVAETEVRLTFFNGIRMCFSYRSFLQGTDIVLTEGTSEHCFIDENTHRPVNLRRRLPDVCDAIKKILTETDN
ncbi:MAG: acyl-CoA thioesterase [Parasporobacterium sp.]|nr:acyl-CoA thioesterase [Parasporobacterium sp.]